MQADSTVYIYAVLQISAPWISEDVDRPLKTDWDGCKQTVQQPSDCDIEVWVKFSFLKINKWDWNNTFKNIKAGAKGSIAQLAQTSDRGVCSHSLRSHLITLCPHKSPFYLTTAQVWCIQSALLNALVSPMQTVPLHYAVVSNRRKYKWVTI